MDIRQSCREIAGLRGTSSDSARLADLLDAAWTYRMNESPEFATWVGLSGHNHRWSDMSLEAIDRRKEDLRFIRDALESVDAEALDDEDRLNYSLFQRDLDLSQEETKFKEEYLAVTSMDGPHSRPADLIEMMPKQTQAHFEDILSRLAGIPELLNQFRILLQEGIDSEITQPRIVLRGVPDQIEAQIVADPFESPLLTAFKNLPKDFPGAVLQQLKREASHIYEKEIAPALSKFGEFFTQTYLTKARDSIARTTLRDGEAWYEFLVRRFTTTPMQPKEIHEIGLSEVERIRRQMSSVIEDTGFTGTWAEFGQFLREDPQFFFDSPRDLLSAYRDIAKRADPELARLFGTLPRLPYGVLPVPSYVEKSTTTAYYQPGSPAVGRAGFFFANTYALESRPKWEMEALTLHEAVPGHHLQIALAQELEGLPEFRKHALTTAYVEGWGLYAESLGEEMGFYKDSYSKFGQLTYEMWRAIRLVVDTGMHALGWSRDQAIEFFNSNSGKAEHDIVVEIDRYISWPGQALAYKIGELKLKELRRLAEETLGKRFDIRKFHDHVLLSGALPIEILEGKIRDWVSRSKGGEDAG